MARRNYRFTTKKQSKKGIAATTLSILSILVLVVALIQSFQSGGKGSVYLGSAGLGAWFLSLWATGMAIAGFREENVFHTFLWSGVLLGLFNVLIWTAIYALGILF